MLIEFLFSIVIFVFALILAFGESDKNEIDEGSLYYSNKDRGLYRACDLWLVGDDSWELGRNRHIHLIFKVHVA